MDTVKIEMVDERQDDGGPFHPVPAPPSAPVSTGGYGGLTRGGGGGTKGFGPPPPSGEIPEGRKVVAGPSPYDNVAAPRLDIPESELAGWRSRLITGVIDTVVAGAIPVVVFVLLFRFPYRGSCDAFDRFDGGTTYIDCSGFWRMVMLVVPLVLLGALGWFFEIRRQAAGRPTMGARRGEVKVVDARTLQPPSARRVMLRFAVRMLISLPPLGAGYFWMFRDRHNRTLHDLAGRTVVLEDDTVERLPSEEPDEFGV